MRKREWFGVLLLFVFAFAGLYPTVLSYFQPIVPIDYIWDSQASKWEVVSVKQMGIWSSLRDGDTGYIQAEEVYYATEKGYFEYYMVRNNALVAKSKNSAFTIPILRSEDGYSVYLPNDFQARELFADGNYALTPVHPVFLEKEPVSKQETVRLPASSSQEDFFAVGDMAVHGELHSGYVQIDDVVMWDEDHFSVSGDALVSPNKSGSFVIPIFRTYTSFSISVSKGFIAKPPIPKLVGYYPLTLIYNQ